MVLEQLAQIGAAAVPPALLILVISYFCGCFNGAVIVSKYILKDDVRKHGSGNAGLTNFFRTFGGPLTLVVILTDVFKAVLATFLGGFLAGHLLADDAMIIVLGRYWGALWCLLGHMYPVMFGFKGGKGILSGGAAVFLLDWRVAAVVWLGFLVLAVVTRYVSLGSCWAGASFPFVSWFVYRDAVILVLAILIGGSILWKHRGNIKRLVTGTENKFSLHKKS